MGFQAGHVMVAHFDPIDARKPIQGVLGKRRAREGAVKILEENAKKPKVNYKTMKRCRGCDPSFESATDSGGQAAAKLP